MDETRSSVRQLLAARPATVPVAKPEPVAEPEHSAYAQGRIGRDPQPSVIFHFADGSARAFAYSYFYAAAADDPATAFTVDFLRHKVTIRGQNLEKLFRLVCQHRVAEICESGRSQTFELAADTPLVTQMDIQAR